MKLTSTVMVHTCLKFDYPIVESIKNRLEFCDEVVVLATPPDDGTFDLVSSLASKEKRIKIVTADWEMDKGRTKFHTLTPFLSTAVKEGWVIHCDADEIIHENSFQLIRNLVNKDENKFYAFKRLNVFGDFDHIVAPSSIHQPCGVSVMRLARCGNYPDAHQEGFYNAKRNCYDYRDSLIMFHYSYVRKPEVMLDKVIDMQTFFCEGKIDGRILKQKAIEKYNPFDFVPKRDLVKFTPNHPKVMTEWIEQRRGLFLGV
jgi:hypothetical protein